MEFRGFPKSNPILKMNGWQIPILYDGEGSHCLPSVLILSEPLHRATCSTKQATWKPYPVKATTKLRNNEDWYEGCLVASLITTDTEHTQVIPIKPVNSRIKGQALWHGACQMGLLMREQPQGCGTGFLHIHLEFLFQTQGLLRFIVARNRTHLQLPTNFITKQLVVWYFFTRI